MYVDKNFESFCRWEWGMSKDQLKKAYPEEEFWAEKRTTAGETILDIQKFVQESPVRARLWGLSPEVSNRVSLESDIMKSLGIHVEGDFVFLNTGRFYPMFDEKAFVNFCFTEDDKLFMVVISFLGKATLTRFDQIEKSLRGRYGEPVVERQKSEADYGTTWKTESSLIQLGVFEGNLGLQYHSCSLSKMAQWWLSVFDRHSIDIEKQLEDLHVPLFQMKMGVSSSQAKSIFRDMLKQAKEASLKEGTSNLPQNFGDILLEKESTNEKIKSMLAKDRNDGVRDEDIRWWWNMHDLERRMMLAVDAIHRMALFRKLREEDGLSEDEARKRVRKINPIFGDPDDTTHTTGEDRPLPFELKDRINIYLEKRSQADLEKFKKEIEESSTFNALIRKEIKKGNI